MRDAVDLLIFALAADGGKFIPATGDEALSGVELGRGAEGAEEREERHRALDAYRARLGLGAGEEGEARPNVVSTDTTRLHTVLGMVRGDRPTAVTLLDLANLCTDLVFRDWIVLLENPFIDVAVLNDSFEDDPFEALPITRGLDGVLEATWGQVGEWTSSLRHDGPGHGGLARATREGWATLLGGSLPPGVDEHDEWGTATHYATAGFGLAEDIRTVTSDPLDPLRPPEATASLSSLIGESNHRALFHLAVASLLDTPHSATVTRLPAKNYLLSQGRLAHEMLLHVPPEAVRTELHVDDLQRSRAQAEARVGSDHVILPVVVSAVLAEIDRPDQLLPELARLRTRTKVMRSHLSELEASLAGPDRGRAKIVDAIESDARLLTASEAVKLGAGALAATLAVAGGPPGLLTSIGAGLSGTASLPAGAMGRLYRRVFRRELWVLTEMRSLADAMPDAAPRIRAIWGLSDQDVTVLGAHLRSLEALRWT